MPEDGGTSISVVTRIVPEGEGFAVYDELTYGSAAPPTLICRFRGNSAECRDYAARLILYWKKRMVAPVLGVLALCSSPWNPNRYLWSMILSDGGSPPEAVGVANITWMEVASDGPGM